MYIKKKRKNAVYKQTLPDFSVIEEKSGFRLTHILMCEICLEMIYIHQI